MTRSRDKVGEAQRLIALGMNDCAIGRKMGIPRGTIRDWRHGKVPKYHRNGAGDCPICDGTPIDHSWYAYLLGMYLGDGYIAPMPKGVFKLRIVCDIKYVNIIDECAEAMRRMRPTRDVKVGFIHPPVCVEVGAYWKHWPCIFPQHGPGMKYTRLIELEPWQRWIVLQEPRQLLRGLIHSDGCRDKNVVNGKSYPRYTFTNNSEDIKEIYCAALDMLGIHWTKPNWKNIAVSRRPDVAMLDSFIGPKS